ncbi:MAG: hypothetical protein QW498_00030 [Thermofilum sp.]
MSRGDVRGRRLAVVAHCLLNQNTVVKPLASHPGSVAALVKLLVDQGYGIVQLPCPEAIYLGMRRWWMSREQYDTISYRDFARKLLEPYVKLIAELARDGCEYVLLGVRGSPSCALEKTTSNPSWMGEPQAEKLQPSEKVEGAGVFMEELLKLIEEGKLPKPLLQLDVDHGEIAEKGVPEKLMKFVKGVSSGERASTI